MFVFGVLTWQWNFEVLSPLVYQLCDTHLMVFTNLLYDMLNTDADASLRS